MNTTTKGAIGDGKTESAKLADAKDKTYTASDLKTKATSYAALACENWTYTNSETGERFSDWFLPSKDELEAMYYNLYKLDPTFKDSTNTQTYTYWSSSEYTEKYSYFRNFDDTGPEFPRFYT